jgi:hypothetical protein
MYPSAHHVLTVQHQSRIVATKNALFTARKEGIFLR